MTARCLRVVFILLASRSTQTVAAGVSDLTNLFFPSLLTPIIDELQIMGYRVGMR